MSVQFGARWQKNPWLGWDKIALKGHIGLYRLFSSPAAKKVRKETNNAIVITEQRKKNANGEDVFVLTTRISKEKAIKAGLKTGTVTAYNTQFTPAELKQMVQDHKIGKTHPEFRKFLNVVLDQHRTMQRK